MALVDFIQSRRNKIVLGSTGAVGLIFVTLSTLWGTQSPLPAVKVENPDKERLLEISDHGAIGVGTGTNAWGNAGQVLKSGGGSGELMTWGDTPTVNTGALQTVFDKRYVEIAGDTMTGALYINSSSLTSSSAIITSNLTVSGAVSFDSTISLNNVVYTFPYGDGTSSGRVLKTDSAGQLSWATDTDTDTTCDGQSCNVTNTGTLDGYEASALLDNTDSQTLSFSSPNISISGGNSVDISAIDTNTTYTAGEGLDLTGTVFSRIATITGSSLVLTGNASASGTLSIDGLVYLNAGAIGNVTGNLTGNADTATALAANGVNCSAGQYPLGIDASGAVESCTADVNTQSDTGVLITVLDNRYVKISGDTMTGNLIIQGKSLTATGIYATSSLTTSGTFLQQSSVDSTTSFQVLDADGGTPIFNIDTTNERVGIGTASPSTILNVYTNSTTTSSPLFRLEQDGSGDASVVFSLTGTEHWSLGIDNTNNDAFTIAQAQDLSADPHFTIISGGNVGIGTASPESSLDVIGTMSGLKLFVADTMSGAGLVDCDNATASKLLWDSTTEQFSCGSDQSGAGATQADNDARYVEISGDTMTGALAIQGFGITASSATITGNASASGTLSVDGIIYANGTVVGNLTGNADTATALATNGANCSAGSYPLGVDASGAVENCTVDANTQSDTGALLTIFDNRYVEIGGDTMTGALKVRASLSGSSLTVDNLNSCDTIDTNAQGVLSCGTDDNTTYFAGEGLDLNGTLFSLLESITGATLAITGDADIIGTLSGNYLYAGTMSGAGLVDCNTNNYDRVQWDATTERFSCDSDVFTLGTDTDGNYTATIADAGSNTIAVVNGTAEGGAVTLDAIDLNCTNCIGGTEIDETSVDHDTLLNFVSNEHIDWTGATQNLRTSGSMSGQNVYVSSLSGANLVDCDTAATSKLLWDATTELFSCGTDTDTQNADQNLFETIAVSGQSNVVADSTTDTLTFAEGSNVTITTNAGTDTITIASTDTNTTYEAGEGLDLTGTVFSRIATITGTSLQIIGAITGSNLRIDNNIDLWGTLGASGAVSFDSSVTITEGALTDSTIVTADIKDGEVIEPDLNADNAASDGDILTYDSTGTNFAWITPNAGTDITADLEEEDHCSEHDSTDIDCVGETIIVVDDQHNHTNATITLASTDLTDTADLLYETELDSFAELQTQIADKTLVNEEDAVTWDSAHIFSDDADVIGTLSGNYLYAGTMSGAGLADCDTAATSKLLWDATTERFSCGTDQTSSVTGTFVNTGALVTVLNGHYVQVAGDIMTGALIIDNQGNEPGLEVLGIMSGYQLQIESTVASETGSLYVKVNETIGTGAFVDSISNTGAALVIGSRGQVQSPGILFGYQGIFDAQIRRSVADTLYTDDSFYVKILLSGALVHAEDSLTSSGTFIQQSAIDSTTAFKVLDADGGNPVFNIDTTNERVGIGTASPGELLEINGGKLSIIESAATFKLGYGVGSLGAFPHIRHDGGNLVINPGNTSNNLYYGLDIKPTSHLFYTTGAGGEVVRIDTDGNVGIGTTSPGAKLDVVGTISGSIITASGGNVDLQYSPFAIPLVATGTSLSTGAVVSIGMPFMGRVMWMHCGVDNPATDGITEIDITLEGNSIFSTTITIDGTETGSLTAATPPVISGAGADFVTGNQMLFSTPGVKGNVVAQGLSCWGVVKKEKVLLTQP